MQNPQRDRATRTRSSAVTAMPLSLPLRLSQGHLNLLATCPRRFQHMYLEQLSAPADFEQQERLRQGSQFHRLMQQWQLGLPVEPLLQEEQLQRWFTAFITASAEILALDHPSGPARQQSEHSRTLEFEGYLLTVVYDLLVSDDRQAKILDWKTYPRPKKHLNELLQNWQTRLYLFVLAETSAYEPEHLSMTYWFFQSEAEPATPQNLTIAYDAAKHAQTHQDLVHLLARLTGWLEDYQTGVAFPQLPQTAPACERCSFTVQCGRSDRRADDSDTQHSLNPFPLPQVSEIPEVPL